MDGVVVSGIGAITALGRGTGPLLEGLLAGKSGIGPIRVFDASGYRAAVAAEIPSVPSIDLSRREERGMSRCDRLAIAAVEEALGDAGLPDPSIPNERLGIVFGAGAGGMLEAEAYFRRFLQEGPGTRARWRCLGSQLPNSSTDWIAARLDIRGPKATISTACSSSATAIGYGADLIREGEADVVITGGAEALCQVTFAGFNSLRAMDPEGCRPFDMQRNGISLGEGAAVLILERESRALARGVRPRARIRGYGITADAYHMTNPPEDARGAVAAIEQALRVSGIGKDEVDLVNAHGTGTLANDLAEARAVAKVFGDGSAHLPMHSVKSSVGHCLGASGAVEAAVTVLSLWDGSIPPTCRLESPDEAFPPVDLVRSSPRRGDLRVGISNSFAFGGNNTVLVFERSP